MQSCSKISGDFPAAYDAVVGVLALALLQLSQLIVTLKIQQLGGQYKS